MDHKNVFRKPKFLKKVKITRGPEFITSTAEFFLWTGRKVLQKELATLQARRMEPRRCTSDALPLAFLTRKPNWTPRKEDDGIT